MLSPGLEGEKLTPQEVDNLSTDSVNYCAACTAPGPPLPKEGCLLNQLEDSQLSQAALAVPLWTENSSLFPDSETHKVACPTTLTQEAVCRPVLTRP